MPNYAIKIKELTKTYNNEDKEKRIILDKLNAKFETNTIHCLLGSSGCGKSTLMRIIGELEKYDSGEIIFDKEELKNGISMIFQENNLLPWYNVYKNIEIVLNSYYKKKLIKKTKKELKVEIDSQLEQYDLLKYSNYYPYELSGGLKQKVALVKTLITNPQIVLFDESFSALDYISKEMMHKLFLDDFYNKQYTAIVTTHDIREAIKLGDYIHILNNGGYTKIKNPLKESRTDGEDFDKFYQTIKEKYSKGG